MTNELPYDFDLLWDIKTKARLVYEYLQAKEKVTDIEDVCKSHSIDINVWIKELEKEQPKAESEVNETNEEQALKICRCGHSLLHHGKYGICIDMNCICKKFECGTGE